MIPAGSLPDSPTPTQPPGGDRGLSPVVGVALLIAVVLALAAVAGGFLLALSDEPADAPEVAVSFDYDPAADSLTLIHESGEPVDAESTRRLVVVVETDAASDRVVWAATNGSGVVDLSAESVTSGDRISVDDSDGSATGDRTLGLDLTGGETVTLLWVGPEGGTSAVLATDTVAPLGRTVVLDRPETVVTDGSAVPGDGGSAVSIATANAEVLGNTADTDGDGAAELPYVDGSGRLNATDTDGETRTLVGSGAGATPRATKARLAAAAWAGTPRSVYYAGDGTSTLYRVAPGGSPTVIATPDNGVNGVLGPGDIDGDGTEELLFADGSQAVRYVEPGDIGRATTFEKVDDGAAGSNNGIGIGPPPDLDGDGVVSVLAVTGSNNIKLVEGDADTGAGSGVTRIKSGVSAAKSPPTAADVDDDGAAELVYLDQGGTVNYVDDVFGSNTVRTLTDASDTAVTGTLELGVVS